MGITNSEDRRKYARVEFSTRIVLIADNQRIEAQGSSKDISLKGVFVSTDKSLPPGTDCDVKIFLTGGGENVELSMKAKVVRDIDPGLGIYFESMDIDTYTHLKNIMLYNSEE